MTQPLRQERPDAGQTPPSLSIAQQDALRVLGFVYLQSGRFDKALCLLTALRTLWPDDPHVNLSLAYARLKTNHWREALTLARPLLATAGAERRAGYLVCAHACLGLGEVDAARQMLGHFHEEPASQP